MAKKTNDRTRSLFDELEEAKQKAWDELKKLPLEEQKKKIISSLRLQHRIDVENACMCGLPIPSALSDKELEAKANELLRN